MTTTYETVENVFETYYKHLTEVSDCTAPDSYILFAKTICDLSDLTGYDLSEHEDDHAIAYIYDMSEQEVHHVYENDTPQHIYDIFNTITFIDSPLDLRLVRVDGHEDDLFIEESHLKYSMTGSTRVFCSLYDLDANVVCFGNCQWELVDDHVESYQQPLGPDYAAFQDAVDRLAQHASSI